MTSITEYVSFSVLLDSILSRLLQCHQDFEAKVHNPGGTKSKQTERIRNEDIQSVNGDYLKGTISYEQ